MLLEKNQQASRSKYTKNADGRFTCPHCEHTTAGTSGMFYHLKKHAGILDYPCTEPGCGKAFIQKSGLQQHMAQAHPSKIDATNPYSAKYSCPHDGCDHSCTMKPNLMIHIARKHSPWIPPYTGTCLCSQTFKSPTAYYYHAATCSIFD